jgi:Cd2+/Zn2+-exporting ATPase
MMVSYTFRMLRFSMQKMEIIISLFTWSQLTLHRRVSDFEVLGQGERIALDGTVEEGESTVNQAPITGESMPVEKRRGDPVYAGTIYEQGVLDVRVSANSGDSTLSRIVRVIEETQGKQAPTQRFVDQFARYYTPAVVVLAVLVAAGPPIALGASFVPWLYKALVMLVIACPCALVISTPVTVVSGLTAAARRGILIKGGQFLEAGHRLKAIAMDKTGTVTIGQPAVTSVHPLGAGWRRKFCCWLQASMRTLPTQLRPR